MAGRAGDDLNGDGMALAASVGSRLRARRAALGWTLAETAAQADVSVSYLSSIEVGRSVPSLPILARVSTTLGLSLNEALRGLGRNIVDGGRLDSGAPGVERTSSPSLELEIGTLVADPGSAGPSPVPVSGGELFVYVVAGALEVELDGTPHMLRQGDSIDAEAPGSAAYRVPDEERSVSVWSTVPGA